MSTPIEIVAPGPGEGPPARRVVAGWTWMIPTVGVAVVGYAHGVASILAPTAVWSVGAAAGALELAAVQAALGVGLLASQLWRARAAEAPELGAHRAHLATVGEMSGVIAHELRNPLAAAKGHAQLLVEAMSEPAGRARAERVVSELVRLEQLTNSLLAFVRDGTLRREAGSPVVLVRDAMDALAPGRFRLLVVTGTPGWVVDAERLGEAVRNVLENALQHSPDGATVEVRVAPEGAGIKLTVRDRGPGVPQERLADLFEPFVTTRTRGTGLGLAVARRNVELHGGSIQASNHPEGGAVFTLVIPAQGGESNGAGADRRG